MDFESAFLQALCLKPSYLYYPVQNRIPGSLGFRMVGVSVSVKFTSHLIGPSGCDRERVKKAKGEWEWVKRLMEKEVRKRGGNRKKSQLAKEQLKTRQLRKTSIKGKCGNRKYRNIGFIARMLIKLVELRYTSYIWRNYAVIQ
jgi:hypothetical protein